MRYSTAAHAAMEIHATLKTARARNIAQVSVTGPISDGFLPLLNRLAQSLGYAVLPYSTSDPTAFRRFGETAFEAATQADPNYGAAWLAWAESALARCDLATVSQISAASSHQRFD